MYANAVGEYLKKKNVLKQKVIYIFTNNIVTNNLNKL